MNYIYLLLCSYGNPQKIIRMMLELKNCKKAVMERTGEVLVKYWVRHKHGCYVHCASPPLSTGLGTRFSGSV